MITTHESIINCHDESII